MIRRVSLGIVILLLCAGTSVLAQDPTAAGLWYPGDIGSYWKYELPPAQTTTATFTKNIKVDSKIYQLIEETVSFFGVINPTLGYDPFLTFRQEGLDRIWGYGKAANELFEGILTDLLQEILREAGLWQVIAKTQATSDEWLLLETSNIGHEWTVMQLETTSNVGVRGLYEIGARLHEAESIQTKAGEFNGFAAEYFTRYTIFNEFGLRIAEQEEPLFIAWLAPGVGIVQVAMDNEIIGRLVEYHIEGVVIPPSAPLPIADFTHCPQTPRVGDWITFDASASYVPSGKVELYEWDWNNDGTFETLSTTSWTQHYWNKKGNYQVGLRVTTNKETSVIITKTIAVTKQPLRERFWEKLKEWWPGGEEGISDEELTDIKAKLNIQNFPYGLSPECIGKIEMDEKRVVDFTWYNDEVLKLALDKELDPNTPELTYYIYFQNALNELDMIEWIWKQENKKEASKFFQLMAGSNERWSSTATIITKGLLTGFLSQPYSSGVSTLLLAFDMVKIGISIKVLDDLFAANSIFGYLSGRVIGDHESAWDFTPIPRIATPQEKKSLEEYLRHLGDTYEEALSKGNLDEFRRQLEQQLRTILYSAIQELPSQLLQQQVITVKSPVELRVRDSKGSITGLAKGELREDIPHSLYDPESKTVIIFGSSDDYLYEVSGTAEGEYGLEINSVKGGEVATFTAIGIPVSVDAMHQYAVDWDALSQKEKESVTVQMDLNGDGVFEQTFVSDSKLTLDEYLSATAVTPKGKYSTSWGYVKQTKLFQNYPNPFNPETWIPYQLSEDSQVVVWIYDTTGSLVRKLDLGQKSAGLHINNNRAVYWDGRNNGGELVISGVYFYTIYAGSFHDTKKMVIVR